MTSPSGALPHAVAARLAGARCSAVTRAACVTPALFTGPAGIEARISAVLSHGYRKTRLPPSMLLVRLDNVVELSSFACQ